MTRVFGSWSRCLSRRARKGRALGESSTSTVTNYTSLTGESRVLIVKYVKYKTTLHISSAQISEQIRRVQASQRKALLELKAVSEELYLKAIAVDEEMLRLKSPIITLTPPIEDYEAPDGQHKDVTKTFEYEVDFLKVLEANKEVRSILFE